MGKEGVLIEKREGSQDSLSPLAAGFLVGKGVSTLMAETVKSEDVGEKPPSLFYSAVGWLPARVSCPRRW